MKQKFLLSCVCMAGLSLLASQKTWAFGGTGWICDPPVPIIGIPSFVSFWFDPALIVATGIDAAATYAQSDRTIDAQDALDELKEKLGGDDSGSGGSGSGSGSGGGSMGTTSAINGMGGSYASSFSAQDTVVLAPDVVVNAIDEGDSFAEVRAGVEDSLFEINGECNHQCALENQNVWLLTGVDDAAAMGDRLLALSEDMSGEYSGLLSAFNGQSTPMGMWAASANITVHTQMQQSDINALYASDLEMNGLAGIREIKETKRIERVPVTEGE